MKSRLFCSPARRRPPTNRVAAFCFGIVVCSLGCLQPAWAGGDAPQWMHALAGVTASSYDEKTDAVLLYSETDVTVLSVDKIRTHVREAYKILRPGGREHGTVYVHFNPTRKIKNLHGWCIPAQGKDYEVKDKDATDISSSADGGELIDDVKYRKLQIPASDPGNIVGYEFEVEEQPFFLQHTWYFQEPDPVRESHFSLEVPAGWEYKATWLTYPEVKPTQSGNASQWVVNDVKGIRMEPEMPPWQGVAGQMIVSLFPPGGTSKNGFANWANMGSWYGNLLSGRMDPTDGIKQQVSALTAGKASTLTKMEAIAAFVQHDIRYVAIELGIGGYQPHAAADVFSHRYGDCKDKATLMRTMLHEIGVDSYHVLINVHRGAVTRDTPAHNGFNHAILAIRLPDDVKDPSLIAVVQNPKLGRILFFDPTNELTPFGQIGGYLQSERGGQGNPAGRPGHD